VGEKKMVAPLLLVLQRNIFKKLFQNKNFKILFY